MNKFLNLFLVILIVGTLVLLVFGKYLAVSGYIFSGLLIYLPLWLYQLKVVKKTFSRNFLQTLSLFIAVVTFFNLLGSLAGYYQPQFSGYDKFTHFINSFLLFIFTAIFPWLFQKRFWPKSGKWLVIGLNFLLVIIGGFGWEFFEYGIDQLFANSQMFGHYGEVYFDTIYDLLLDLAGGLVASVLIYTHFYDYMERNISLKDKN